MDIRQYRDDGRNYIIIKAGGIDKNDYQYRMVQQNDPEHLLHCRIRDIDEERFLYYEISGLYSLDQLFGSARMKETEIRRLYTDLKHAREEAQALLLNPEGLFLAPEYIYREAMGEGYRFLYCVGLAEGPGETALEEWVRAHREEDVAGVLTTGNFLTEEDWTEEGSGTLWRTQEEPLPEEDLSPVQATYGSEDDEERPRGKLGYIVMGVLFAMTMAAIVILRTCYELTTAEHVISGAIGVVSALMTGISFYSLRKRKPEPENEAIKAIREMEEEEERLFRDSLEAESLYRQHEALYRPAMPARQEAVSFDEEDCETVLLQQEASGAQHKLYSRDEGRLIKIDLSKLPLTVGKLPGVADFLLKREEISRLHVRFFHEEGSDKILMKDLNSTNGTYRNGLRLNAGESVALLPGDEVRLGSMEFEFV